jgi:hypothetical protein
MKEFDAAVSVTPVGPKTRAHTIRMAKMKVEEDES